MFGTDPKVYDGVTRENIKILEENRTTRVGYMASAIVLAVLFYSVLSCSQNIRHDANLLEAQKLEVIKQCYNAGNTGCEKIADKIQAHTQH